MKELPATLILRPFNFDTLAIRTYQLAADERLPRPRGPALDDRARRHPAGDPSSCLARSRARPARQARPAMTQPARPRRRVQPRLRRRGARRRRDASPCAPGEIALPARPVGLRQDHAAAPHRRARAAAGGRGRASTARDARATGVHRAAGAPRHRPRVPGLRAVPAPDGRRATSPSACSDCPRPTRGARGEVLAAVRPAATAPSAYPHTLSGGEQQRVALARALAPRAARAAARRAVLRPRRAAARAGARRHAARAASSSGAATLIVTHDPEEAMFMADRIAVMRDGRIVQAGARPRSTPAGDRLRGRRSSAR